MASKISPAVLQVIERHAGKPASLLALLHEVQDIAGHVSPDLVPRIAAALNLSRAEVHGVMTYYHDFRTEAPPRVVVRLCRAEACRSMHTEALAQHIEAYTGCRFDARHDAGEPVNSDVGLESVYCLGQCALSPAMILNEKLYAKVTPQKFDALFDAAAASPLKAGASS